jgi:hypothetical protein
MLPRGRIPWLKIYYAATPLFALADWGLGANVRAVALAGFPGLRTAYYGLCFGCAFLLHVRPGWANPVALAESSGNILLLVLSIMLPYYGMIETLAAGGSVAASPITSALVANFLVSGSVWSIAFYARQAAWGKAD